MSEPVEQPEEEAPQVPEVLAPGLAMALAPQEEQQTETRRRGPDPRRGAERPRTAATAGAAA